MTLRLRRTQFRIAAVAVAMLAAGRLPAQRGGPPPIVSPEIADNGDVTFRLRAAGADAVRLAAPGDIPAVPFGGGLDMAPDAEGVWSVTIPGLDSGGYRYNFNVDGVTTLDPANPMTSQSNGNAWSLVYVPGAAFMDTRQVAHGAVAEVTYFSTALGRHRRMHVYTPPGYERDSGDYPVFYLLHGAGDSDDSWSTVGRAGFILDNLIASGNAAPMVVVMPDGHTTGPYTGGADNLPVAEFADEFITDIKPYVDSHYRVRRDRASTAIAGLSMGGAQTLEIGISHLDEFAYLGVFSSGVFSIGQDTSFEDQYREILDDASLKRGLDLVWFSTGSDDFLLDTTKATVAMLRGHGFGVVFEESTGGHTWINWRNYLKTFTPQLFR